MASLPSALASLRAPRRTPIFFSPTPSTPPTLNRTPSTLSPDPTIKSLMVPMVWPFLSVTLAPISCSPARYWLDVWPLKNGLGGSAALTASFFGCSCAWAGAASASAAIRCSAVSHLDMRGPFLKPRPTPAIAAGEGRGKSSARRQAAQSGALLSPRFRAGRGAEGCPSHAGTFLKNPPYSGGAASPIRWDCPPGCAAVSTPGKMGRAPDRPGGGRPARGERWWFARLSPGAIALPREMAPGPCTSTWAPRHMKLRHMKLRHMKLRHMKPTHMNPHEPHAHEPHALNPRLRTPSTNPMHMANPMRRDPMHRDPRHTCPANAHGQRQGAIAPQVGAGPKHPH